MGRLKRLASALIRTWLQALGQPERTWAVGGQQSPSEPTTGAVHAPHFL